VISWAMSVTNPAKAKGTVLPKLRLLHAISGDSEHKLPRQALPSLMAKHLQRRGGLLPSVA